MKCGSTHGGAGYAMGSYWLGSGIVCGECGKFIENPPPTGGIILTYKFMENPIKWFRGDVKEVIPTWPNWIRKPYGDQT